LENLAVSGRNTLEYQKKAVCGRNTSTSLPRGKEVFPLLILPTPGTGQLFQSLSRQPETVLVADLPHQTTRREF
jgi:hypothetical protein